MTLSEAKRFVEVWYESNSLEDVQERLGIDRRRASNYAGHLRRAGVPLPAMKADTSRKNCSQLSKEDVEQLRRLGQILHDARQVTLRYRGN